MSKKSSFNFRYSNLQLNPRVTKILGSSFIILAAFVLLLPISIVKALESSESATSTQSAIEEIQENLKERIQKVVKEKAIDEKVKEVADKTKQKRGFIGEVERVSDEILTIKTRRGTEILQVTDQVSLIKKGVKINLTDIEIGNNVVVIGFVADNKFEPRRILVSSAPLRPTRKNVYIGNVANISNSSLTLLDRSGSQTQVSLRSNTRYQDANGKKATRDILQLNQDIILIAIPIKTDENQTGEITTPQENAVLIRSLAVTTNNDDLPE